MTGGMVQKAGLWRKVRTPQIPRASTCWCEGWFSGAHLRPAAGLVHGAVAGMLNAPSQHACPWLQSTDASKLSDSTCQTLKASA